MAGEALILHGVGKSAPFLREEVITVYSFEEAVARWPVFFEGAVFPNAQRVVAGALPPHDVTRTWWGFGGGLRLLVLLLLSRGLLLPMGESAGRSSVAFSRLKIIAVLARGDFSLWLSAVVTTTHHRLSWCVRFTPVNMLKIAPVVPASPGLLEPVTYPGHHGEGTSVVEHPWASP